MNDLPDQFMPNIPNGLTPSGLFQISGVAPGANGFDEVDIVCDSNTGGDALLVDELPVNGTSFATAAVTDVVNALSIATGMPLPGVLLGGVNLPEGGNNLSSGTNLRTSGDSSGADQMCNIRAYPANNGSGFIDPADTSAFKATPVGFGYLEEDVFGSSSSSDALRQDYRAVSNNVNGRWEMTSAGGSASDHFDGPGSSGEDALGGDGDDGLAGGGLYRGSNFSSNYDSIIEEVAFLTADEGPSSGQNLLQGAGIQIDGRRGRLADEDHQWNSLENGTHVNVERSIATSGKNAGEVTITETQKVVACKDTNEAFPSLDKCAGLFIVGADYEDTGVNLKRVYQTSNQNKTVTITDTWTNTTLDETMPVKLVYDNEIEWGAAVGYQGGPIEVRQYGDSPDLSAAKAAGKFTMILDGDETAAENSDSADDGAVTYNTLPDKVVFLNQDEWYSEHTKTLAPGQSLVVEQVWNQVDTLPQARQITGLLDEDDEVDAPVIPNVPNTPVTNKVTETVTKETTRIAAAGSSQAAVTQQSASRARTCTVPRLRGRSRLGAERALVRAGCSVGRVRTQRSKKVRKGRVISQSRAAGRIVAAGTAVQLRVAR